MDRELFHLSCFILHCLSVLVCTSEVGRVQGERWSCVSKACKMWQSGSLALQRKASCQKFSQLTSWVFILLFFFCPFLKTAVQDRVPCIWLWLVLCKFSSDHSLWVCSLYYVLCTMKADGLNICSSILQFTVPGCKWTISFFPVKLGRGTANVIL